MARFLRRLRARIKYWNNAAELKKELDAHREMAAASFAADGTPERESRWKAARLLGNTAIAREDCRAVWVPRLWQEFRQDARYALRGMRRDRAFTLTTVLMLSVGIGLTTGGLGFINGLFLRGWPVPDNASVFRVEPVFGPTAGRVDDGLSLGAWRHISRNARVADYVAFGATWMRITRARGDRPDGPIPIGMYVSENFFGALRVPLAMGTPPLPEADSPTPTVVISHRIWQTVFAGDPSILGRTIWLDGEPAIAVGVAAPAFTGLDRETGVYAPIWAIRQLNERGSLRDAFNNPDRCCFFLAGRDAPGAARVAVASELTALVAQYRSSIGAPPLKLSLPNTTGGDVILRRGNLAAVLALIGVGAVALLVLTCANVGNLQLARSLRRRHEIVTRLSLGASRARIVRQLLTEGLVLASLAGTLAFAATASVPPLAALSGESIPESVFGVDWRVAMGTAGTVTIVCAMVSLAPALQVTRIVWRGSAALATARTNGLRGVLLAVQLTIATVLISSAALIVRGIQHGVSAPADFAMASTTAALIEWPSDAVPGAGQMKTFRLELRGALGAGGTLAGLTSTAPVSGRAGINTAVRRLDSNIEFGAQLFPMDAAAAKVLKLRMTSGRWASDDESAHETVVNQTLARTVWGDSAAVGQTLRLDFDKTVYTVVGVVTDAHILSPGAVPAIMHIPPIGGTPVILVESSAPAIEALRGTLKLIAPAARVSFMPLSDSIRDTLGQAIGGAFIASGLGFVALLLAMTGAYGVFSYLVEERRREIGIRVALGASRTQIRAAIFRATRTAVTGGVLAGLALSIFAGLALRRFLFGLSPADPISYVIVALILSGTALIATLIPVRRALRVNPAVTLRAD